MYEIGLIEGVVVWGMTILTVWITWVLAKVSKEV